jgi:hypothetical protein
VFISSLPPRDHVFCSPMTLLHIPSILLCYLSHGRVNVIKPSLCSLRALICQPLRQEMITSQATRVLVLSDQQRSWRHARIVLDKTMELLVLHYRLSHVVGSNIAMAVGQGAKVTFISCAICILGTFSETCQVYVVHSLEKLKSPQHKSCFDVTAFFSEPCVYSSWTSRLGIVLSLYSVAVREHMTLCVKNLKMRCACKSDAAVVCAKLKAMSKLTEIYLYQWFPTYSWLRNPAVCLILRCSAKT